MQWLTNLANGVRSIFHKQRVEDELNEELENYLDASMADKVGRAWMLRQRAERRW